MRKATVWKALGLAGAAGVAATGVLVVRSERERRAYTPDEIRERLHERHVHAVAADGPVEMPLLPRRSGPLDRLRRRISAARTRTVRPRGARV